MASNILGIVHFLLLQASISISTNTGYPRHMVCSPVVNVYASRDGAVSEGARRTDFRRRHNRAAADPPRSAQSDEKVDAANKKIKEENEEIFRLTQEAVKETKTKFSSLEFSIDEMRGRVGKISEEVDVLRKRKSQREAGYRVAFSAQLSASFGPIRGGQPTSIPYDKVTINLGNGYDNATGVFTCPISGVYVFQFHATKGQQYEAHVKLVKNDKPLLAAHSRGQKFQIQETSNSVIVHLDKDDKVWTSLGAKNGVPYQVLSHPVHRYTTFSGFLLWPDA